MKHRRLTRLAPVACLVLALIQGQAMAQDINAEIAGVLPDNIGISAADGPDATSKTNRIEIEGCMLSHTLTIEKKDKPDLPYRQMIFRDLRVSKVQDVLGDDVLKVDVVRLGLKKGEREKIEAAIEPARNDFKQQIADEEDAQGLSFIDFDKRAALADALSTQMGERIKAGEYGDVAAKAFTVVNGMVQPPLPFAQLYVAPGEGQKLAEMLQKLMDSDCN